MNRQLRRRVERPARGRARAGGWLGACALVLCLSARPEPARANGAFPDSMAVLLPADQPQRIVLATNFGLVVSDDGGTTWRWICEQAIASYVSLYQLGPPPADTLFAVTFDGLSASRDGGCTWKVIAGAETSTSVSDVFPDPRDPDRVFSIARPIPRRLPTTATIAYELHVSDDGASTLGQVRFTAPTSQKLQSVESARSDPRAVYLTMTSTRAPPHPSIVRTLDGETFETLDAVEGLGMRSPRIAQVDPVDPLKLYLRVLSGPHDAGDSLAITEDGGLTSRLAHTLGGAMSAFLRRSDGGLFVASIDETVFSSDGGNTFAPWPGSPHFRALAERDGVIYAAADNFVDGFALGASHDGGMTWTPLFRFVELDGPLACPEVEAACREPWLQLKALFGIDPPPPVPVPDPEPKAEEGCGCATGHPDSTPLLALAPWALLLARRRPGPRSRTRTQTRPRSAS